MGASAYQEIKNSLRRLYLEEYSESHRAMGLPDDLLNILKDDLAENEELATT